MFEISLLEQKWPFCKKDTLRRGRLHLSNICEDFFSPIVHEDAVTKIDPVVDPSKMWPEFELFFPANDDDSTFTFRFNISVTLLQPTNYLYLLDSEIGSGQFKNLHQV